MDAFANYQRTEAWTWEHQALVRARMVAGSEALQMAFDEVRETVLSQRRPIARLRQDVDTMRQRMFDELASRQAGRMDLKQDKGGIVDIEFLVQLLVLAHASEHPPLLAFTDNIRLLEVLEEAGLLEPCTAQGLRECYRNLRARLHRQSLRRESGPVPLDDDLVALREQVRRLCAEVAG